MTTDKVFRHTKSLARAANDDQPNLWLQTSETSRSNGPKLMVRAVPIDWEPVDHDEAHPAPSPLVCE